MIKHSSKMDSGFKLALVFLLIYCFGGKGDGLSYDFYEKSCPQVENIVRNALQDIFFIDLTAPPALLRLMFHDCQVQGCDASILIDPRPTSEPMEMASGKNFGIQKRELIGTLKSLVEAECPGQVSCADILVLAAREAVAKSGGPRIRIPLGRRDSSRAPSRVLADSSLPPATIGVDGMLSIFREKGMTIEESVAILGAHTLGVTHCVHILNRLHNLKGGYAERMGPGFEAFLRLSCTEGSFATNLSFVVNDPTAVIFDNQYFINAIRGHGVLRIDAEIAMDQRTAQFVHHFANDQDGFFCAFSSAFVKLSLSGVLTGNQGVNRKRCNALS